MGHDFKIKFEIVHAIEYIYIYTLVQRQRAS